MSEEATGARADAPPIATDAPDVVETPLEEAAPPVPIDPPPVAQPSPPEPPTDPSPGTDAVPPEGDASAAEEGAAASVQLVYRDHQFTDADVADVLRIQAHIRRQQAIVVAEQRRQERKAEAARRAALPPIELPDEASCGYYAADPRAVAMAKQQQRNTAANGRPGASGPKKHSANLGALQVAMRSGGGPAPGVDYSKLTLKLNEKVITAETKTMQMVYTRMLKTKSWL